MRAVILVAFVLALGCDVMVGQTSIYDDSVELPEAKAAFGCDAPAGPEAERACSALAAFEAGDKITSYPKEGVTLFAGMSDCTSGSKSITLSTIALKPGTPPGKADEAHRAPGVMWTGYQTTLVQGANGEALKLVMDQLAAGKGADLTPQQLKEGARKVSWAEWKKDWEGFDPEPVPTAQSDGKSLLERLAEPGPFPHPGAYWRESKGSLIKISRGWCVEHYYPLPAG